jgi:hypothetical protein
MTPALYILLVACGVAVVVAVTKIAEWWGERDHKRREHRAFEALIVYTLRRERDIEDLDDLPELTESQRAAMNSLPSDFVERLLDATGERD